MSEQISIRKCQPEDTQALAAIYYHTIHLVNSTHYTKEQVDAWAPITSTGFFDALLEWYQISAKLPAGNRIIYVGKEDQIRQKGSLLSLRNISLDKF